MNRIVVLILFFFSWTVFPASHHRQGVTKKTHPNGDVYFLVGKLEPQYGLEQATAFLTNSPALNRLGFRTLVNLSATVGDLYEAVKNPRTRMIIWTSHGDKGGGLRDANNVLIPRNIFCELTKTGSQFGDVMIHLTACFGKDQIDFFALDEDELGPDEQSHVWFAAYEEISDDPGQPWSISTTRLTSWLNSQPVAQHLTKFIADSGSKPLKAKCDFILIPDTSKSAAQ
ncbi:MAG: hypothetical protein AB7N80_02710 [Bdellovibrionales bacterium]